MQYYRYLSMDEPRVITKTEGDVTVVKSYNAADYPLPVIEYQIEHSSAEPTDVSIIEEIPDFADSNDIGIHPDTRSYWSVLDGRLVFEYRLPAGQEFTTAFSYKPGFEDQLHQWMSEPTITVEKDPPEPPPETNDDDGPIQEESESTRQGSSGGSAGKAERNHSITAGSGNQETEETPSNETEYAEETEIPGEEPNDSGAQANSTVQPTGADQGESQKTGEREPEASSEGIDAKDDAETQGSRNDVRHRGEQSTLDSRIVTEKSDEGAASVVDEGGEESEAGSATGDSDTGTSGSEPPAADVQSSPSTSEDEELTDAQGNSSEYSSGNHGTDTGREELEVKSDAAALRNAIAELQSEFSKQERELKSLTGTVETHDDTLDAIDESLGDINEELDAVKATLTDRLNEQGELLEDHDAAIEELVETVSAVETGSVSSSEDVTAITEAMRELREEIDERLDSATDDLAALAERVDDNADELSNLSSRIDSFEEQLIIDEDHIWSLDDLGQRLDRIEDELAEYFAPERRDADILAAVQTHAPAVASEVAEELDMSRRAADYRLRRLFWAERVAKKQIRGTFVWYLPEDSTPPSLPPSVDTDRQETSSKPPRETVEKYPQEPDTKPSQEPVESVPQNTDITALDEVDFPSGRDREQCEAAVLAARDYLREHGPSSMREIVMEVMEEHPVGYDVPELETGDRYRGAWWRKVVKPGLEALSDVTAPDPGASNWEFEGTE